MSLTSWFVFFLILHTSYADKRTLPVFMIDHDQVMVHVSPDPNPFSKLTSTSFADIVHDSIRRSEGVIIFVEDYFSMEDVSTKDRYGTPFINLRMGLTENKVKYFPAVSDPYTLLTQVFKPQQNNVFYLTARTKLHLMDNFKYIYIYFQDSMNETRSEVLRRHDSIIREVVFVVRQLKPGPVLAFYTGKRNPVVVQKTDYSSMRANQSPRAPGVIVKTSGALIRFSGVFATTPTRRVMYNQKPVAIEESFTKSRMSIKFGFYPDITIVAELVLDEFDWGLKRIVIMEGEEEVGRTNVDATIPWNWSYVCTDPLVIYNTRDGSFITISEYQLQPKLFEDNSGNGSVFGDSINCGPYFNTNIISALGVSGLLMGIAMYGIMTLFDCVSCNRFEDAQGKGLTQEVMH